MQHSCVNECKWEIMIHLGAHSWSPFAEGDFCTLTIAVMNLCGKTKQSIYAGVLQSFCVMIFATNRRAAAIVYPTYPKQVSVQSLRQPYLPESDEWRLLPRSYPVQAPLHGYPGYASAGCRQWSLLAVDQGCYSISTVLCSNDRDGNNSHQHFTVL